jgi:hypothetical protein
MSEAQVKREIQQPEFGLKWKETIGDLPRQHIVVFEKPVPGKSDGEKPASEKKELEKKDLETQDP